MELQHKHQLDRYSYPYVVARLAGKSHQWALDYVSRQMRERGETEHPAILAVLALAGDELVEQVRQDLRSVPTFRPRWPQAPSMEILLEQEPGVIYDYCTTWGEILAIDSSPGYIEYLFETPLGIVRFVDHNLEQFEYRQITTEEAIEMIRENPSRWSSISARGRELANLS